MLGSRLPLRFRTSRSAAPVTRAESGNRLAPAFCMAESTSPTDAQVQRLHDEERDTRARFARAEAELEAVAPDGVADSGDLAVRSTTRDNLLSTLERLRTHLDEVVSAIGRVESGTYGLCIVDGQPIDPARLDAIPWAEYCLEHQPESASPANTPTL